MKKKRLGEGDFFGENIFTNEDYSNIPVQITGLTEVTVATIKKKTLREILQSFDQDYLNFKNYFNKMFPIISQ